MAERGDENELVLAAHGHFPERIVEENRARFRRHELVRFLQDLAKDEVEVNHNGDPVHPDLNLDHLFGTPVYAEPEP